MISINRQTEPGVANGTPMFLCTAFAVMAFWSVCVPVAMSQDSTLLGRKVGNYVVLYRIRSTDQTPLEGVVEEPGGLLGMSGPKTPFKFDGDTFLWMTSDRDSHGEIVRRFTIQQLVSRLKDGENTGQETGIRRVYSSKDADRQLNLQVLVRYALDSNQQLSRPVEGVQECISTKRGDLQPGSRFFGKRIDEQSSPLRFDDGRVYVVRMEDQRQTEYCFDGLTHYLAALKSGQFPEDKKTGTTVTTGQLSDGRPYAILKHGDSRLLEIYSLTEKDEGCVFRPHTELRGTWVKGDKDIAIGNRTTSYNFIDEAALERTLSADQHSPANLVSLKPTGTVVQRQGTLPDGRPYVVLQEGDKCHIEIYSDVARDSSNFFRPRLEYRGPWSEEVQQ